MLEVELMPGKGVGPFELGATISKVFEIINTQFKNSHVLIKYDNENPLTSDFLVDLVDNGILLRFDPVQQRLLMLELYKINAVSMQYMGTRFGCNNLSPHPPTFVEIYRKIGPSYPGEFANNFSIYLLHYPGISFKFPISHKFRAYYEKKFEEMCGNGSGIIPVEFPDGSSPMASRVSVYFGSLFLPKLLPLDPHSLYFETVLASNKKGIYFTKRQCNISFESTVQDVISGLGSPDDVFYKEEDKMRIHATNLLAHESDIACGDYFFNFFQCGLDILFDCVTHTVKKIILHTNPPNHQHFNRYSKCNFRFTFSLLDDFDDFSHLTPSHLVTADSTWDDIKKHNQKGKGKEQLPVVLNAGKAENPFGATLFYGFDQGIIFEILPNGHLASLTLFVV